MNQPVTVPARPAWRSLILAAVVTALAACTNGATATPLDASGSPGASPAPTGTPVAGAIDHKTGATDVLFRFDEGGGFVPMGFFATSAPILTLYGDGTVIFRDLSAPGPPGVDGEIRMPPFKTTKLTEDEIQGFLEYAIADGAMGVARENYDGPGADLPTAMFTLIAGDTRKTVSVMALGMDREPGPDTRVLTALAALGEKVRNFAGEVDDETDWVPDRWRGILNPDSFAPPRAWPWPDITPAEFVQHPEPDAPGFPVRTMTPAEVALLGYEGIEGGFSDLSLTGPDDKLYTFALRPLLPDEAY